MKILIVGAGVIGTMYGWALSESGHDVTHFVKHGRQDQLKGGIHLDIIDDRKGYKKNMITQYALKCVEVITPANRYEIIVLPIHFYQMEAALQTLVPVSGDALFLHFGSNWNGMELIDRYLARERYLLGFPYGGGLIQNGKHVTWLGPKVHVGEVDGNQHTEKLECVKSLFAQADIHADMQDNILHMLWTSHVAAVGLAAGIAKSQGTVPFLRDRALMAQCYHIVKELYELCRLRGLIRTVILIKPSYSEYRSGYSFLYFDFFAPITSACNVPWITSSSQHRMLVHFVKLCRKRPKNCIMICRVRKH